MEGRKKISASRHVAIVRDIRKPKWTIATKLEKQRTMNPRQRVTVV
jgi:hypothetical protein